jgi:hypothetical protein
MPRYTIQATRAVLYEFQIEAESEAEALEEMQRIEISENAENYADYWYPLEVTKVTEEQETK